MPENAAQLHGLRSPLSNATTARVSGYEPSRTGKPQLDPSLAPTPHQNILAQMVQRQKTLILGFGRFPFAV